MLNVQDKNTFAFFAQIKNDIVLNLHSCIY